MKIVADEHPQHSQLIAYGQGRLEVPESEVIEQHLDDCRACCETLLNLQDDTFMQRLRGAESCEFGSDTVSGQSTGTDTTPPTATDRPPIEQPTNHPPALADQSRYEIAERIGQGGMGAVYRAKDTVMDRTVALKVVNPKLVANQEARQRFEQEVRAAARLSHPNIVTAFDAEVAGKQQYLVMEYVQGKNLADLVREQGPLSVVDACTYISQAASGLQHAFERDMVHRDIKPHNLMLVSVRRSQNSDSSSSSEASRQGRVRILDFGLSRFLSESEDLPSANDSVAHRQEDETPATERLTKNTTLMGTLDYISPEQARDARSADIRSDIYSLGCTLFFLLTGQPPFPKQTPSRAAEFQRTSKPPRLSELRADVSERLDEVIEKMIAADPDDRFSEPSEIETALTPFTGRVSSEPAARLDRKRTWLSARVVVVGIIGLLLAGIIVLKTGNGEVEIEVPDNATVRINDKVVTIVAGMNRLKIEIGTHKIEIVDDGWTSEQEVTIRWRGERVRAAASNRPPASIDEQWVAADANTVGFCPSSDGSRVVAGSWSPEGPALLELTFEGGRRNEIDFEPNFDSTPGLPEKSRQHHGGVALSADNKFAFVTNYYDDDIYRIDLKTGDTIREFIGFHWAQTLRLSADRKRLVACFGLDNRPVDEKNDGLAILDVSRNRLNLLTVVRLPDEPRVTGLALSADSQWAFVITRPRQSEHPTLYRVGLNQPFDVRSVQIADSDLSGIAVSVKHRRVFVSDSATKQVRVFDPSDLSPLIELPFPGASPGALAMGGDDRLLVALSPEARRLYCLDPESGVVLGEATGLDEKPADVQFSRDNRFVVVSHNTPEDRFARFLVRGLVDRIVFASNRGDASYQLYTAKTNGRDVKPVRPNLSTSRSPRWSPDGTMIAFVSTETGKPRICTIRRDGAEETFKAYRKTSPPGFSAFSEALLDWSPDGSELVFVADDHTSLRILKLTDDSEGRELISGPVGPGAGQYDGVSWSTNGILLSAAHHANGNSHEIFQVNPDSGEVTQLTDLWDQPEYFVSPVGSADGNRIAAAKIQKDGDPERRSLFLLDRDGRRAKSLTNSEPGTFNGDPRWFPTGDRLIFTLRQKGERHRQLYSISGDGTDKLRLTNGDWDDAEPDVWTLK